MNLHSTYKTLLKSFGPQGWWPTTPVGSRHPVYVRRRSAKKLSNDERFEISLGAFLTQNTSWGNVEKVLSGLSAEGLLSFTKLAGLPVSRLETLFRSSGYFRQKAARIKNFFAVIEARSQGDFQSFMMGPLPEVRRRLLALKGVGPETADSILLYAGGRPTFVVDAYTRRVAQRWGILQGKEPYEAVQSRFAAALPRSTPLYSEYHALIVQLAKQFCHKRNPLCGDCPLHQRCPTAQRRKQHVH